jgi:hypothetical protein
MSIQFANYGQERERIATESELEIFEILKTMSGSDKLKLVRKSDNYVTAIYRGWDLARFKYTPRAKWISFPTLEAKAPKHRIEDPSNVTSFVDLLADSIAHIDNYSK